MFEVHKGRTTRKLMGRGGGVGGAKYKENIRARENKMKKNSYTPINPKNYSCYGLKKIHTRNMIYNFPNGPSLTVIKSYTF